MSFHIGIDIGAVSLKLAAIGESCDLERMAAITDGGDSFFLASLPTRNSPIRPVLLSAYRRIHSSPVDAASKLLNDFDHLVPREQIHGIRVTGSGAKLIAEQLSIRRENEFRALAKGIRFVCPEARTVFEIGGETAKYLLLADEADSQPVGVLDYQTSTECAAGTGAFIEQQASRLGYTVEKVGEAACHAHVAARIAGRCSVFAKTDMIHAQQRGYSCDQVLRGLCDAVARNFKCSILKGRRLIPPIAFVGGVAWNQGVRLALQQILKDDAANFMVPELGCWVEAIGAAILAGESASQPEQSIAAHLPISIGNTEVPTLEPLSMANVLLLRDRVPQRKVTFGSQKLSAYLGIDVGSVSTNLVVLDAAGNLLKEIYLPTAGRPLEVVNAGLQEIERELGGVLQIRAVGTTGSGRELVGELVGADTVNDEITAHKTGALHVHRDLGMEDPVDTIFEIGGQDAKFIRIDQGVVVDFAMNEACAAGTGSFLEEQAEKLGISVKEQFARLALASKAPVALGERCTVFMERAVSNLLSKGSSVEDLCAGLAYSIAQNYLNRVVRGRKIGNVIYFQGGTAYNDAVAAAFAKILGKCIIVPPHNGVIGAIGMALIAQERMAAAGKQSRFRGYDLSETKFTSRDFTCTACSNYCEMKEFVIDGQKSYWGDKCSDKFRKRLRTGRQTVIDDLLNVRERLLTSPVKPKNGGAGTIGIPRGVFYYGELPFWATYLQELGYDVVVSPNTDCRALAVGEELAIAQPCLPVQLSHAHVARLLELGVDYVLLPNAVDAEAPSSTVQSKLCPWNQTLPFVISAAPRFEGSRSRLLIPTVHFRYRQKAVAKELRDTAAVLNRSANDSDRATVAAYQAQAQFRKELLSAGKEALSVIAKTGEPAVVLLGRPYNIYDSGANCDVPRKLHVIYGINVIPLDFLPLDEEDISEIDDNMYWNSGRLILSAAHITARFPQLHWIYISNFKCGPDSFIKAFLPQASGKPGLILQFDGHSNDAGYLTRCEAYLESKGVFRCTSSATNA